MSQKLARIISTVFVPPSFSLIFYIFVSFSLEPTFQKSTVMILVALIFGFVAPILLFVFMRKNGKLVDLDASIKEERTIPFLIAELFYLTGLLILILYKINIISIAFWFCYISNTLIIVFINKYWKISVHAMGAAGPTAALVFIFGWIGLSMLIIVALVGWSRIKLRCHSVSQVLAGALFGFTSTYFQIYLILKIFNHA
ncbi:MAG: phosphatase PAP2 family protein [Ignavibacteriaceae bacterium]